MFHFPKHRLKAELSTTFLPLAEVKNECRKISYKKEINTMEKAIQMTIKVSPDTYKAIQKLAAKGHENMSVVVREFIDKGLNVQGYKDDIDFITRIIRQEVRAEIGAQSNRLRQIMFKIGAISSSNYFLAVRMLADVINPSMREDFKDINTNARKLGEEFMEMKYSEFRSVMESEESVEELASQIRRYYEEEF